MNDTESEHWRKEKSMTVKEGYTFSNLETHVLASYARTQAQQSELRPV